MLVDPRLHRTESLTATSWQLVTTTAHAGHARIADVLLCRGALALKTLEEAQYSELLGVLNNHYCILSAAQLSSCSSPPSVPQPAAAALLRPLVDYRILAEAAWRRCRAAALAGEWTLAEA